MHYNTKEIFNYYLRDIKLNKRKHWNSYTVEDDEDDNVDTFSDFTFSYGASKFVIVPEISDYVIKIPFNLRYDDDLLFDSAYYAEDDDYGWDYCRSEAQYYRLAKEEGLESFFAETRYIGSKHGYPIYVQEKCLPYSEAVNSNSKKDIETTERKISTLTNAVPRDMSMNFLTELFKTASEETIDRLFNFIYRNRIYDLRDANCGFLIKNNKPVLVDYASFNE